MTNLEDLNQVLYHPPLLTSQKANWSNIFLAHYQHPGSETCEHTMQQLTLEIMDVNSWTREIATVYSTRLKTFVTMSVGHLACLLDLSFDILRYEWIYFLNIHKIAPQLYRASNGRLLCEVLRTHPDREKIVEFALKPGVLEAMQKLEQANPLAEILLAFLQDKLPEPQQVSVPTFENSIKLS